MPPRVYVILLNWNGASDTMACLESLMRLEHANYQLVVCENGSADDSVERLRAWASGPAGWRMVEYARDLAEHGGIAGDEADLFMLHTGANLGFAGGCNVGLRFATARGDADFVWLLNNDTEVSPDALSTLVARASQPDSPGIVGSLLCYFDERDRIQSVGGGTFDEMRGTTFHIAEGESRAGLSQIRIREAEATMTYVVGASMLVSSDFLARVGLMEEDYFLYYEEMDWAERARRAQPPFKLGLAADSVVFHKVGASAGTHQKSLSSLQYLTRSRMRFIKRFYPRRLRSVRLHVAWEAAKALVKGRVAEARLKMMLAFSSLKL
ncbi:glycosyltransferase family 2 protein [Burkholderiaceae bacterium UC74_6]